MDDLPKLSLRLEEVQLLIGRNIESIVGSLDGPESQICPKEVIEDTERLINECEALPRLLDPHLQQYIDEISAAYLKLKRKSNDLSESTNLVGLVLTLAKVRGYKFVSTFFSTDVYLIPEIIALLQNEILNKNTEESYFLLIWLLNLVLVPFPLNSIADSLDAQIFTIANKFLSLSSSASKIQTLSLSLLALLLTRRDGNQLMDIYIDGVLKAWINLDDKTKLANLMTFNQILKRASSAEAAKFAQIIYHDVVLYEMSLLVMNDATETNNLNIKYLIKVVSKISKYYISSNEWDIVADNVDSLVYITTAMKDRLDMTLRECLAKCMSRMVSDLFVRQENYAIQLITYMLHQLKADLPNGEYSEAFRIKVDASSIPIYHAILLFMGFLAMTKSLPVEIIPVYLSIIHQTSFVSYKTTGLYQCSQIRDASCFCMWALIKNITNEAYTLLLADNFEALKNVFLDSISIALFDEDYTIRRCGIAVLQEFSGRLGSEFFPLFLQEKAHNEIGKFTIQLVELFGNKSVGSLSESHELIPGLVSLGIPKAVFVEQMMVEIDLDFCSFPVKIVAANRLAKLVLDPSLYSGSVESQFSINNTLELLLAGLLELNYGSLYALAELQKAKCLPSEATLRINSIVCELSFDIHTDRYDKGEALLNWFIAMLQSNERSENQNFFPIALEISRLNYNASLILLLRQMFSLMPKLDDSDFESICGQIRLGNHLLAKSICSHKFYLDRLHQLVKIVLNKSVDAQTRAFLVAEFIVYVNEENAQQSLKLVILSLLDDYTISAQGDVGLLVRKSCIDLLSQYSSVTLEEKSEFIGKLIRIAGETIDKLRLSAFKCLCLLVKEDRYSESYSKYNSDYKLYFKDFFEFVSSRCFATEFSEFFWTGIVLSAGASVAGSNLINLALRQFLYYLETDNQVETCLMNLLKLLKIPSGKTAKNLSNREKKIIAATLNVFVRVFESAIRIPNSFDYETLFIRCYNLHINTVHTARISLVIEVFQHLSCGDCPEAVAKKSKMRLIWLARNSPIERIRSLAKDAIFELILELKPDHPIISEYGSSSRVLSSDELLREMESIVIGV